MNIAVFPGTFDPFTLGHFDIVERASCIFDKVIVAVAADNGKSCARALDTRMEIASVSVAKLNNVSVKSFGGFLADFATENNINVIIRGLRGGADFEYEKPLGEVYRKQNKALECIYLISSSSVSHISSSIVRQIASLGGNLEGYVCHNAEKTISKLYKS